MPIPKSMSKSEKTLASQGTLKHIKKPDVDNLIKLYLDVITGIAIKDDSTVSLGQAIKVYSASPKTVIYVEETKNIVTMEEIYEGTWEKLSDSA